MKKTKRALSAALASFFVVTALGGCAGKDNKKAVGSTEATMPKSLKIFAPMGANLSKIGESNNENLGFQLMEKMTGCHVEWIQPSGAAFNEKFNLLIASGEYPDMIAGYWKGVSGGVESYVDDGVIVELTDLAEKYMPNLSEFNSQRPEIKRQYTNDDGKIFFIPFIRKDPELKVFFGPQIREDWLDKLSLEMPETADELYDVLKAFKTQDPNGNGKADEIPMSGVGFSNSSHGIGNLLWAFGTTYGFYVEDGTVKYGYMEKNFEEGIRFITKLFKEGLIDVDFILQDRAKMDAKFANNEVGFMYSMQPTKLMITMSESNPKVKISAVPHLSTEFAQKKCFASGYYNDISPLSITVTTANKNPGGSLLWLDNFFGGKGYEYVNFGEEGKSFEWKDGYPQMTDYVLNNPEGKDKPTMFAKCVTAFEAGFPLLQDWRYYEQSLEPAGKAAIETWADNVDISGVLPPVSISEKDNKTVSKIMSQITTFCEENINRIIMGEQSLDTLSDVRKKIEKMGIDEVLSIYQGAYERYNAKK